MASGPWSDDEIGAAVDVHFRMLTLELARAGEESVAAAERERLAALGRKDLAAEVRHVSVVDGAGLGYDNQSFHDTTDAPAFIMVKTTRCGKEVPFYISATR